MFEERYFGRGQKKFGFPCLLRGHHPRRWKSRRAVPRALRYHAGSCLIPLASHNSFMGAFSPLPGFYQSPSSRHAPRFLGACSLAPIPGASAASRHSAVRIPLATSKRSADRRLCGLRFFLRYTLPNPRAPPVFEICGFPYGRTADPTDGGPRWSVYSRVMLDTGKNRVYTRSLGQRPLGQGERPRTYTTGPRYSERRRRDAYANDGRFPPAPIVGLTHVPFKMRGELSQQRDVKNEGCSGDVHENKGKEKIKNDCSGDVDENT